MKLQEGYTEKSLCVCGLLCWLCTVLCVCEGGVVCVHFYVCRVDVYLWVCT